MTRDAQPSGAARGGMSDRFRKFLPVVVDVETGGLDSRTDALLEIAAVVIDMDESGQLQLGERFADHVLPFEGARCDDASLKVNHIDPYHPLRLARDEKEVLTELFAWVSRWVAHYRCTRAIMVAHNAFFDHKFVFAAAQRCGIKQPPFHSFSTLDTVTVGACAYGETVLAKIARAAGVEWNEDEAHSAVYDAEVTAQIFCGACNRWPGFDPP